MADKELISQTTLETKTFLIEVKAIKGVMVNPEHPITKQYILMTSQEAEARMNVTDE